MDAHTRTHTHAHSHPHTTNVNWKAKTHFNKLSYALPMSLMLFLYKPFTFQQLLLLDWVNRGKWTVSYSVKSEKPALTVRWISKNIVESNVVFCPVACSSLFQCKLHVDKLCRVHYSDLTPINYIDIRQENKWLSITTNWSHIVHHATRWFPIDCPINHMIIIWHPFGWESHRR